MYWSCVVGHSTAPAEELAATVCDLLVGEWVDFFLFLEDKPQLCSEEQLECNVYNQKQEILLGKFE